MNIRNAKVSDVSEINALITSHAELERMLFRSVADIYESLQSFVVAEIDGKIVGCCALSVIWADLCEVKSLAVDNSSMGKGIGKSLVLAIVDKARELGLKKVFTLTLEPKFFERADFQQVEKEALPMKVWSDCARCSKQDHCDEIALVRDI